MIKVLFFDVGYTLGDEGAVWDRRCKTQAEMEEACMIGDRIDNDVIPAKSIGMKTIWVKQGFGALQVALAKENAPDQEVGSLSELLRIL